MYKKRSFLKKTAFETKVYTTSLVFSGVNNKKIKKHVEQSKEVPSNITTTNVGGWNSEIFSDPFPICLEDLHKEINEFVQKTIAKDFQVKGDSYIHTGWYMSFKKGDFMKPHTNPPYTFSGIYFLEAPKESIEIVFKNSMEMNNYATSYKELNQFNCKEYSVIPQTEDLLIFPSWLESYMKPNKTNKEAIFYKFNI